MNKNLLETDNHPTALKHPVPYVSGDTYYFVLCYLKPVSKKLR